eukprot:6483608-Amphidinium_carterae.4
MCQGSKALWMSDSEVVADHQYNLLEWTNLIMSNAKVSAYSQTMISYSPKAQHCVKIFGGAASGRLFPVQTRWSGATPKRTNLWFPNNCKAERNQKAFEK